MGKQNYEEQGTDLYCVCHEIINNALTMARSLMPQGSVIYELYHLSSFSLSWSLLKSHLGLVKREYISKLIRICFL